MFVCGFAIDHEAQHVLMVQKTHPDWQKGRLNGLGGGVKDGETPAEAMAREFREETIGLLVGSIAYRADGWKHVVSFLGDAFEWQCLFFVTRVNFKDIMTCNGNLTDNKERLLMMPMRELHTRNVVVNLRWLIPFAASFGPYRIPLVIHEQGHAAIMMETKMATQPVGVL